MGTERDVRKESRSSMMLVGGQVDWWGIGMNFASTERAFPSGSFSKILILTFRNRATDGFDGCGDLISSKEVNIDWIS